MPHRKESPGPISGALVPRARAEQRLRARVLVPVGPAQCELHADHFVRIGACGRILELGPWAGQAVDEDLRAGLLGPGWVDAHLHFPQTRVMGQATGPLLPWLEASVFPEEARFAEQDYAREVAGQFCEQLLRVGTTSACVYGSSHLVAAQELFAALSAHGLRAAAGPVLMDQGAPPSLCVPSGQAIANLAQLHDAWQGADEGRLELAVIPRFALSCSAELMSAAGEFARTHGLCVSTHLAETQDEVAAVCARYDAPDYLEVYERFGLVAARTLLAHCVYLSDDEWRRLSDARAVVAHCPDSNDFLGSGSMPTARAIEAGARLSVGSDVAAGRGFCMRAHLRAAYDCALRGGHRPELARLFWWATSGGLDGLALGGGTPANTQSLATGAWADMVLYRLPPWLGERTDSAEAALRALIFDPTHVQVTRTWAGGREYRLATGM